MFVISLVLHNNLILFGSPASTASRPTAVALTAGKDPPREPTFGHSAHHRLLRVLIELLRLRNRSVRKSPLPPHV